MANSSLGSTPGERTQTQPGGGHAPGTTPGSAGREAPGSAGSAGSEGRSGAVEDAAQEAKDTATDLVGTVREEARRLGNEASDRAQAVLRAQREAIADEVGSLASALQSTSKDLDREDHPLIAGCFDQAARSAESWSRMLRERNMGELVDEASSFARRQPAIFLGGAMAAGFLLARFLQSSSERAESGEYGGGHERADREHGYRDRDHRPAGGTEPAGESGLYGNRPGGYGTTRPEGGTSHGD
jgi:hypothetical protein